PYSPPSPEPVPQSENVGKPTSTGLPANVAATLACIPLLGGLIFYVWEKHDRFVRFYAMQSIIFGGIWLLFHLVSSILWRIFWSMPVIGSFMARLWFFIADLVHLGFFVIMVFAMVKAFSGSRWDIPYVGPMARKQMGETL
ncbi:MAG: hypothetical protein M3N12_02785, partial [Verrucomicrobiota bacterium]|nr:hypothetical protein [Verrucomicrobiota bacterium]